MNWLTSIRRGRADNSVNWHTIVDALVQAPEEKPIDAGGGNKHRLQGTGHGDSAIATKAVSTEPERWCLELWKGRAVWICWWLATSAAVRGVLESPKAAESSHSWMLTTEEEKSRGKEKDGDNGHDEGVRAMDHASYPSWECNESRSCPSWLHRVTGKQKLTLPRSWRGLIDPLRCLQGSTSSTSKTVRFLAP